MTSEISNYLKRCQDPRFAIIAALRFMERGFWSVVLRCRAWFGPLAQPPEVRRLRRLLLKRTSVALPVGCVPLLSATRLTLAVGTAIVTSATDWRQEFEDDEVAASLHRWNWLLRGITDDPIRLHREDGISLIRSWITECLDDRQLGSDAYSAGERIVNGSIFMLHHSEEPFSADIASAFRRMGRQIATNLEYVPAGLTGNHAFNNARALLFSGALAKLEGASDLAYAIAAERLPTLVTADGFMREGSAHYHFLFTRWVLEMLWLARRTGEERFVALLSPYAAQLVSRCRFFLVSDDSSDWKMPLIGDVSPDFPPEWLVSLPLSGPARTMPSARELPPGSVPRGWADLFDFVAPTLPDERYRGGTYPSSGWFRIDRAGWTLFLRATSHDGEAAPGHGHHDLGSFALFRDGVPVLVDCGRSDYTGSVLSAYGTSAMAHNSLLVDGLGPLAEGPAWLSTSYASAHVCVTVNDLNDQFVVAIAHTGFQRLAGGAVQHRRLLSLDDDGLRIEDHLDGDGTRDVVVRLHLGPETGDPSDGTAWRTASASGRISADPRLSLEVVVGRRDGSVGGVYFPAYGHTVRTRTLETRGSVALPSILVHVVRKERS